MLLRTGSWWIITILYILFFTIDYKFSFLGFTLISLLGIKELFEKFDDKTLPKNLKWICYLAIPVQFLLSLTAPFGWVMTFIPVILFVIISLYVVLFDDVETIFSVPSIAIWSMLLVVYGLVHISFLYRLPPIEGHIPGPSGLVLYYLFLVQFNDVLQFLWGSLLGKHKIAPTVSPNKTWEGFLGGLLTSSVLGVVFKFLTPLTWQQAAICGFIISLTGFLGDLTISAVKRKLRVKDMGRTIPGHGGVLDRIDSVTLSSLIYFYLIFYWFYT